MLLAVKVLYLLYKPKVGTKLEHERRKVVPYAIVENREYAENNVKDAIAACPVR